MLLSAMLEHFSRLAIIVGLSALFNQRVCSSEVLENNRTECKCSDSGVRNIRSDDSDPYRAVIEEHSQHIQQLTAQLKAVTDKLNQRVAFYCHFTQTELTNVGAGSTLKFDAVDVNIGAGYDANTGIFRAPFSGVYFFHIKMLFSVNYSMRLDMWSTPHKLIATTENWADPAREVSTAQGIVHLDADQSVWVGASPFLESAGKDGHMYGSVYTTFSGHLLYPD